MKKLLFAALLMAGLLANVWAASDGWRKMTPAELKTAVPDKAPVVNESIETEFRTASGITDGQGHNIFGVVIITAGYAADGKYTHYFATQTQLRLGDFTLPAGDYLFGYQRATEGLRVTFYHAHDGRQVGEVMAQAPKKKKGGVYSFLLTPPNKGAGTMHIGRFFFTYTIA